MCHSRQCAEMLEYVLSTILNALNPDAVQAPRLAHLLMRRALPAESAVPAERQLLNLGDSMNFLH